MRIAVTGTPGCGKTTLCALLAARGEVVVSVADLASRHDAVAGRDDQDEADVIDIDALRVALAARMGDAGGAPTGDATVDALLPPVLFIDGHLAHLLPVHRIWVLRCSPDVIRQRLEARGYNTAKVRENVEAEAMDLILQEALDQGVAVVQRDGTRRSPAELLAAFEQAAPMAPQEHDLELVDWSAHLLE